MNLAQIRFLVHFITHDLSKYKREKDEATLIKAETLKNTRNQKIEH